MTPTTATAPAVAATSALSTWKIDPAHSAAEFKVRHMMISYVKGRFSGLSGVLKLDETDYAHSFVEVSIPACERKTVDDKLDAHLKDADFFDVEKFPTLTFKSTSIRSDGDRDFEVTGDLTIRGVTKIRDFERERCEPTIQRSLGESAHRSFRVGESQSQGFWSCVECAARTRRHAGWRRSDDHAGRAVYQRIISWLGRIQIMGGRYRVCSSQGRQWQLGEFMKREVRCNSWSPC